MKTAKQLGVFLCALGLALMAGAATLPAQGAPTEGIKVHGHWVIDVRNPDGSLASHNEFENALITFINGGSSALAGILAKQRTVGQWIIRLSGGCTTLTNNNNIIGTIPSPCEIYEPTSPATADTRTFKNLTVAAPITTLFRDFETGTIELSGFVTATSATPVGQVETIVGLCEANVLPAACAPGLGTGDTRSFSGTLLATPIVPTVGQIIQVKVILSFS